MKNHRVQVLKRTVLLPQKLLTQHVSACMAGRNCLSIVSTSEAQLACQIQLQIKLLQVNDNT